MKRAVIVLIALAVYVPLAYCGVALVAMLGWILGRGMCDFNCGSSPDLAAHIAYDVAVVLFLVGALGGVLWIGRGGPNTSSPSPPD